MTAHLLRVKRKTAKTQPSEKNMHYKLLSKPKTSLSEISFKNINVNRKLYLLSISLNKSRICIVKRI